MNDLSDYMESLRRLRDLPNLRVICPGHGPLIDDPLPYIDGYISHREQREREIVEQLASGEALTSWQLMERLYKDVEPAPATRWPTATCRATSRSWRRTAALTVHAGKPRQRSESELAQAAAEEAQRAARSCARRTTTASRRAAAPSSCRRTRRPRSGWKPPRYELS